MYDLMEALKERGHSEEEIAAMSPEKKFAEWCGWHLGDSRWASTFVRIWNECNESVERN